MTTGDANNQTENRLWCAPIAKQSIPTLCKRLVHREGKSAIASTVTQILNKLYGSCGKRKVHIAKDGPLHHQYVFGWATTTINTKYLPGSCKWTTVNHGYCSGYQDSN